MSKLEKAKQNLNEIIKLVEPEINKNDENVTAILDLKDLKSLSLVLEELNNSIPKQYIQEKIEEKCKALRHRTHIEEILEYEFHKLKEELLEGK